MGLEESHRMRLGPAFGRGRREQESLFARARRDPSAFADVYRAYHPAVLRYFARRTLDPDVAFDLVAETFVELFANVHHLRGTTEEAGRAWMWRVARSNLYDWIERGRVERRAIERMGYQQGQLSDDTYSRIEELADFEEARRTVLAALATLAESERMVLHLRIVEERPFDEIAKIIGASSSRAARQQESKARRRLAQVMDAVEPPHTFDRIDPSAAMTATAEPERADDSPARDGRPPR